MSQSRADAVKHHLLGVIREGGLTAGGRLPSVRQLAEDCGVTTPTVREALRSLESAGVVELRHGSGTYVSPGAFRLIVANPTAVPTEQQRRELLHAREVLEPAIAAEAARHRTPAHADALADAAEHAVRDVLPDDHVSFHVLVARATGNVALVEVVEGLLAARRGAHERTRSAIADRTEDREQHRAIAAAVAAGDADAAERLMRDHLRWLAASGR